MSKDTETTEADLNLVEDDYTPGYADTDEYWGDFEWAGTGKRVYDVTGTFRRMVLERVGRADGDVKVVEDHRDIGYCPSCTSEVQDVMLYVDGVEVFRREYASGSPFSEVQAWLTTNRGADRG